MSRLLHQYRNELGLVVATTLVVALAWCFSNAYATAEGRADVARDVLRDTSLLGIFALGAATVIIAGGIDLSSGSMIAFSATLFYGFLILLAPDDPSTRFPSDPDRHFPNTDDLALWIPVVALLGVLVVAFLVGSFHAWLITVLELPPFVATLASLVGLRSLARLLIQDISYVEYGQKKSTITIGDEFLTSVAADGWWIPCVVFAVLSVFVWLFLGRTVVGRHVYAMGGNETAARLSGIRTGRLKWLVYCIGSMTAALAGVLYSCKIGTASPATDGMGYELNAIAAAVVGGCSLAGGVGSVAGVMMGALFLRVVIDSVAKLFKSQPTLLEGLVVGTLVVLTVAFNELRTTPGTKKAFFPGPLGILNVYILSLLAGVITFVTSTEGKAANATTVAVSVLVLAGVRAGYERLGSRAA